jgi:N-methylhydantoinase B
LSAERVLTPKGAIPIHRDRAGSRVERRRIEGWKAAAAPRVPAEENAMRADLERLAEPRARLSDGRTVDPVITEVIRGAMETICFEMAVYVSRTATTPILNQSNERNASICDRHGRLAAVSVGIPQLMLASSLPIRYAVEFFGDDIHPGDVFLSNDPYHGGGHLPDYNLFAPVFADGRFLLMASIQCHHGDTGGSVPGGYNVTVDNIWGEGIRFPAIKLIDKGVEREDIFHTLAANNRQVGHVGDIRAQAGAAQLGARRLEEILAAHGADAAEAAVDEFIDSTSRQFREEIASWPDGEYEADVYVDHDPWNNKDIHVHVKLEVKGDRLVVDFEGTDDRPNIQAWSSYGNTRGYVISQIASCVDPKIPKNEGFFEAIDIKVPLGCVLNPHYGKPVSAGTHHPGTEVGEVLALALQQIKPDRAVPQVYKTGIPTIIASQDPRTGEPFTDHSAEVYAGWCNAAKGMDAWGAQAASFGNLWKATAEINESLFPHIQWSRDYRTDSGGPGQWRGLCGSHYEKEVLTDGKVYTYVVGKRYPMPGIAGGKNGEPNRLVIRYGSDDPFEVQHIADWIPIQKGQRIMYDYGGGGGWGNPLDRDPEAVLDDVLDEYVSIKAADADYGVVINGSLEELTLEIDHEATKERRAAMRAA